MPQQLECRIMITYRQDKKIELAMVDPKAGRVEPLGIHGPSQQAIDKAVEDLKVSILRAGHRLTWCERSE